MFKNLILFRIGPDWNPGMAALEAGLDKNRFVPCGPTQQKSLGWVEPRGEAGGALVESVGGHWLLKLLTEQRVVPSSAVKQRVDEIVAHIEQTTGRKPGKKEQKELKEQALHELLPRAFTRQSATRVWIAPQQRLLVVDAGSQGKADEVTTLLVKEFEGLALSLIQTAVSPAAAMTDWLGTGEAPAGFSIERECELKTLDEMKSVVRYARHLLDTDEVRQHILVGGKVPTRLAMTWQDRVSFMLTDTLQLKKLAFQDVVFEDKSPDDDGFDADAAIATGELIVLLPALFEVLGGEQEFGAAAAAPALAPLHPHVASGVPAAASAAVADSAAAETPPWED
ncbi:recombination-associated protein RdgC [Brachymonas chironomi]|uniref:recombination-associated protein RdgC n=1 Tax=Brachymonas chironomi TaxID=491919 RepID=UPI000382B547|nr:recombination-associated protein RdgC [Brachymonas chironomi]